MTDKQIIIDGVDVSGCEFFETKAQVMQCHRGALTQRCKANNCYYKQLKAKEQECEELKRINKANAKSYLKFWFKLKEYKQTLAEIKEIANKVLLNTHDLEQFKDADALFGALLEIHKKISEVEDVPSNS